MIYGERKGKTRVKTDGGQLWFSGRDASRHMVKSHSSVFKKA